MPAHQGGESRLIPMLHVATKELAVGQSRAVLQKDGATKMLHDSIHPTRRHGHVLVRTAYCGRARSLPPFPSYYYYPRDDLFVHVF
jgi:hypothetical protein